MLILYALGYGFTMKVADLLNEHGLKWFRGSALLFGMLWGTFGALLVTGHPVVANLILAMNLAFLIRNRLDYLNHQVATTLIIITFLFTAPFYPLLFVAFFATFLVFGWLKDYVDDILKEKNKIAYLLCEAMLYYPVPTLIYCLLYGQWIVFWVFLTYTVAYDVTKLIARRRGYR